MGQYIKKSALVAEIERLQDTTMDKNSNFKSQYDEGIFDGLSLLENFLDTLEVKWVDFENIAAVEWDDYIRKLDGEPDTAYMLIKRNEYIELARHFFELGLKAQKEENAKEERYVVGVTGKYTTTTK